MHANLIKISSSQKLDKKTIAKQQLVLSHKHPYTTYSVTKREEEIEKDCNSRYKPEIFPTSLQHPWPPSQ